MVCDALSDLEKERTTSKNKIDQLHSHLNEATERAANIQRKLQDDVDLFKKIKCAGL